MNSFCEYQQGLLLREGSGGVREFTRPAAVLQRDRFQLGREGVTEN